MAHGYICTLDKASLLKAEKELNEDPQQRMSAVETLRKWLEKRKDWIRVPTDTYYLLSFLRMKKFNQMLSRDSLVMAWELRTRFPQWYKDVDPGSPRVQAALSTGQVVHTMCYYPVPGRDRNGRKVIMIKIGNLSTTGKKYDHNDTIQSFGLVHDFLQRDENVQVNGFVYVLDLSGFTMSHVTFMGHESFIKGSNCWMKAHGGRSKELHFYNGGPMFDVLYGFLKQSFSKKIQDRVINHANNFSTMYKYVDKSMLPEEYLPDDYDGQSAGPKQKIIDEFLGSLKSPEFREYMANLSNGQYFVDSTKKPKRGQDENASFRPLVVS